MAKQKDDFTKYPIRADFYNENQRSPQSVPWMNGTEFSPDAAADRREFENKDAMNQWNTIDNRRSRQEMFRGQYTTKMVSGDKKE